jgi:hypothetical protein
VEEDKGKWEAQEGNAIKFAQVKLGTLLNA